MKLLAWLSSQLTELTASWFISPWPALGLSLLAFVLLLVWLWGLWSSAKSLGFSPSKTPSRSELRELKGRWALQQLRTVGLQMAIAVVFFILGAMWQGNRQLTKALQGFDNTVQILNAVVEKQDGLTVTYHYLDDPAEKQHAQIFCAEPANRVPHFKPRQIIASMELVRHDDCEVVADLMLRRVNGVAVLASGGY